MASESFVWELLLSQNERTNEKIEGMEWMNPINYMGRWIIFVVTLILQILLLLFCLSIIVVALLHFLQCTVPISQEEGSIIPIPIINVGSIHHIKILHHQLVWLLFCLLLLLYPLLLPFIFEMLLRHICWCKYCC